MSDIFNTGVNPVHSGVYVVDRGEKLGTPLRWYNADNGEWSRCEYTMEDVLNAKGKPSALGFLPWRGPIKVAKSTPAPVVDLVNTATVEVKETKIKPVKVAKVKAPKAVKVTKSTGSKATHPDGTIVFRADRNKYMAWFGGKAEAARPTIEAAQAFLTKKYNVTVFNIIK